MKQIIIALQGDKNTGKSTTLNMLSDKLHVIIGDEKKFSRKTKLRIFNFLKMKIGVTTRGDTADVILSDLTVLINESCDIIFCACHIDISTVQAICDSQIRMKFIPKTVTVDIKKYGAINDYDSNILLSEIFKLM